MLTRFDKIFNGVSRVSASLRDAALAMLYPNACRVCGRVIESWRDGVACANCWQEVERRRTTESFCVKCGAELEPLPPQVALDQRRCGRCSGLAFDFARACGPYEGALRESVLSLKLYPHIPPRLRQMLRQTFAALPEAARIESIIPVPLHPTRLAERGFNQAEVIARELASGAGLRVDRAGLVRVKKTERHRAGMAARERARSLERAFNVRASRLIEGRGLLVVDDVMTTGSTAHEIAETLLRAKARSVHILTLARASHEFSQ
jgi:ComF family protein